MKKNNFYITTPLYYINDQAHLGTAYTTIMADVLNRYHQFFGKNTFFLTGTDEHGQKCQQAAQNKKIPIQDYCDDMSQNFKSKWKQLNIQYDLFFRTSFHGHKKAVQQILQKLYEAGDIYSNTYEGWYCVSDEIFYTQKDLVDGKSPSGKKLVPLKEKAWFFKMSKYQKQLQKHLDDHPDFIQPVQKQNEIQGFLKQDLQDLCISRPKARVSWGIELPFDSSCVTYVWFDALCNYITGIGYLTDPKKFHDFWETGQQVHLIGKDILIPHAIYWPCILMSLSLPLPNQLLVHGWILNSDQEKMSKSQGDKLDPLKLLDTFAVDEFRWFVSKDIPFDRDVHVSPSFMKQKINESLSDGLGNIFSRLSRLIDTHFDGYLEPVLYTQQFEIDHDKEKQLKILTLQTCEKFQKHLYDLKLAQALELISFLLVQLNKYLEQTAPWTCIKNKDFKEAKIILYTSLEILRICSILLHPVMPNKMTKLLSALGEQALFKNISWGHFDFKKQIKHPEPLFPKIKD